MERDKARVLVVASYHPLLLVLRHGLLLLSACGGVAAHAGFQRGTDADGDDGKAGTPFITLTAFLQDNRVLNQITWN